MSRTRLFRDTVVRVDSLGRYWLMNRPETGWSSFGRVFRTLAEIEERYAVEFGAATRDDCSEVIPARAIRGRAEAMTDPTTKADDVPAGGEPPGDPRGGVARPGAGGQPSPSTLIARARTNAYQLSANRRATAAERGLSRLLFDLADALESRA